MDIFPVRSLTNTPTRFGTANSHRTVWRWPPDRRTRSASSGRWTRSVTSWSSWSLSSVTPTVCRSSHGRPIPNISSWAAPRSRRSCWSSTLRSWSFTRRCRTRRTSRWRALPSRRTVKDSSPAASAGSSTCATWRARFSTIGTACGSTRSPSSATISPSSGPTRIIASATTASSRATTSTWSRRTTRSWRSPWTRRTGWRCSTCRHKAFTCGICATSVWFASSRASRRATTPSTRVSAA